ncbi:MAG: hypothetical protein SFY66_19890 [Oculatellaceae cyanobacterium bins.114]|nr:hypothetical protein [Oculatellaceae cyanobacterium bins.114]
MQLSDNDLKRFEAVGFEILEERLPDLEMAIFHLDLGNKLNVICLNETQSKALVDQSSAIAHEAWLVFGCELVQIWLGSEQLIAAGIQSAISTDEATRMTVTLEKPVTQANGATAEQQTFYPIEQVAQSLAAFTKLPADQMIDLILESRPLIKREGGVFKVMPSAAIAAFRQWASEIEVKLESGDLAIGIPTPTAPTKASATRKVTAKKTPAKKTTTKKPAAKKSTPTPIEA